MHTKSVPKQRNRKRLWLTLVPVVAVATVLLGLPSLASSQDPPGGNDPPGGKVPRFEVDPFWPKPLPEDWILGEVSGTAVDQYDNVWVSQRPNTLTAADIRGTSEAPPVLQFDSRGNLLQAFGPSTTDPREWDGCEWPVNEHGMYVDGDDNVWIAGNGSDDHQVLKLSNDGSTCLLQIGRAGQTGGPNDTELLGQPADTHVDDEAREVYIADGYGDNHRVIVFDSDTGEYKRHWGAFGQTPIPEDPDAEGQFGSPVHCAVLSDDGLVYVCDRPNNRVHVFEKDGTFVEEFFVLPETERSTGTTYDVEFSPDRLQTFLYDADGSNSRVHFLLRSDLQAGVIGGIGRGGRYAGQFLGVHTLDVDSKGNMYTSDIGPGRRVQKFEPRGFGPAS